MSETTAQPSKPPPIPGSVAEHMRPNLSGGAQEFPRTFMIHVDHMIPNLTIKEWASRMFKFAFAAVLVGIAMLIPVVIFMSFYTAATRRSNY